MGEEAEGPRGASGWLITLGSIRQMATLCDGKSSQLEETLDPEHWGDRSHREYRQELGIHNEGSDTAPPGTGRCLQG